VGGRHAAGPRLVRRYENRKLYDARARRPVTLDDLASMIAAGEDVQVVERASGEDITTTVLAQVIFEGIKQRNAEVPRQVLARLIRFGRRGAAAPESDPPPDSAGRVREEAERIVAGFVQRGRLTLEEALALRQEIADSIQRFASEAQRSLEQRVRGLLESGGDEAGVQPALRRLRESLLEAESRVIDPGPRSGRAAGHGGSHRKRG